MEKRNSLGKIDQVAKAESDERDSDPIQGSVDYEKGSQSRLDNYVKGPLVITGLSPWYRYPLKYQICFALKLDFQGRR